MDFFNQNRLEIINHNRLILNQNRLEIINRMQLRSNRKGFNW
jgi:hypothetical protein